MAETSTRQRLDAVSFLVVTNFLLLLGIGVQHAPATTVGVVVLMSLIGYGLVRTGGGSS